MNIQQFSQQGKRSNNEDSLGTSAALLTVCDGMGGHNYGERASAFVKEAMLKAFTEPMPLGKMEIQQQLNQVQADLNRLLEKEPELEKMGTTFTGVFITPDVWYAAHIGDSRIYLFRPSEKKLWHTWDHSLVGELMRTKEITIEAGRFHPMSNRISKAIIAQKDGKPVSASVVKIDELKKGDIFMLCSDGVVEGWGDWELVQLFSDESLSFEQKCKKLAQQCNAKSKDNNTAIIAEIGEEDAISFGTNDELDWTTFDEVEADYRQYVKDNEEVEEEAPKATKVPNPQTETPTPQKPQAPNPQPGTTSRQTPKPVMNSNPTEKKSIKKLLPLLVALLLIIVGLVAFLKKGTQSGTPEEPDLDTQAYKACNNVADYRAYISEFGSDALHYADAKAHIDQYETDSIRKAVDEKNRADAQAAQDELERREKKAYDACTTIGACDSYLRVYPTGKYVKEVNDKMKQLEQQAKEEADKMAKEQAQAEAERKEDDAYKKCKTIDACDNYLKNYPQGRYLTEVTAKKAELEKRAEADAEAKRMKEEDDAYKKCTTIGACDSYLKAYPQGRYLTEVKAKKDELTNAAKEQVGGVLHNNQTSWTGNREKNPNSADTTKVKND